MSKIKICGLSRTDDILSANEFVPDYAGFVFSKSKRQVTAGQARLLKEKLSPKIKAVGVFVNEPVSFVAGLVQKGIIDLVQLHGDEDEAYIRLLKQEAPCPVIKAVRVQSREQISRAQRLPCDYLLLDAYSKNAYGGTGDSFRWDMIPKALSKLALTFASALTSDRRHRKPGRTVSTLAPARRRTGLRIRKKSSALSI